MSKSKALKLFAAAVLLTACGGGGGGKPAIHLDMGTHDMAGGGQCSGNQKMCNGFCTDTSMDNSNCGNCGVACTNGQTCMNSQCSGGGNCTGKQIMCNGSCTDTSSDNNNCGSCGNKCTNGQTCSNSKCSGGGQMTGCSGLVMCINGCAMGDMTCPQTCFMNATMNGQNLFQAVLMCLQTACPSMNMGDVCFTDTPACDTCFSNAQMMNGACYQQLMACDNDLP